MNATALEARDLRVRPGAAEGRPAAAFMLEVESLALRAGEALAILGPNGAGKSTLLRALAGVERCETGSVVRHADRPVAMVFQRPVTLAGSVSWNVALPLFGAGVARAERRRRTRTALERFGIAALASRDARTLSGGEARRVALAQAFVREPAVLLLDEPFDDLDARAQERLSLDLAAALAETGIALALVTHDLRQALLLADRVAVLVEGRIAQIDRRDVVLQRPATIDIAPLVGMSNLLPGIVGARDDSGARSIELAPGTRLLADTALPEGTHVIAGVRPEQVKIDVGRGERFIVGKGRVLRTLSDGLLVTIWIDWNGFELRTVTIAGRGLGHEIAAGDCISLAIRPDDVHVLER